MIIRCEYSRSSHAIQQAIDALDENGGTVIVPAGEWHTGPLHLKSHLKLELEEGSILVFSSVFSDYLPPVLTRWEGTECYNYSPLIYAKDCQDITIYGKGILYGSGNAWWSWKKKQQKAADELCTAVSRKIPVNERIFGTETACLRPSFLQLLNCQDICLKDFTIVDGPQWTIHPVYCSNVYASNIKVFTHGPNTDGFNPDSCEHVMIDHCIFHTGDDCIAINSGLNEDGWRVGKPCHDIEIANCLFSGGHAAVAIGSAMSGGVDHVNVHDCTAYGTERGIRIKSMPGRGGYVRNIHFKNISISDPAEEAVEISMHYGSSTSKPVSAVAPIFEDIYLEDVKIENAVKGVSLCGLEESPLRIHIRNLKMNDGASIVKKYAETVTL
jgi:polygalacturonase